jgi:iron complex outermembrane receptor protein
MIAFSALIAETTQLPTLEVHAQHPSTKLKNQTGVDAALSQKVIAQSGAQSITALIRKQGIASIQSGSGNPNQTSISMEGFADNASANTLLLIDGIPISSFTNVGPNLNNVILSNIDSLSIKPGSYSVLYGNQAVSGILAIKTREPKKSIIQGNLGIGNMGQIMAGFYASDRTSPAWGYNVGVQSNFNQHKAAHSAQHNSTFNINIHHYGTDNITSLNALSYINNAQMPPRYIIGETGTKGSAEDFHVTGNIFYLTNRHLFSNLSNLQTRLAFYQTDSKLIFPSDFSTVHQKGLYFSNKWQQKKWLVGLDDRYNSYHATIMSSLNHAFGNIISAYSRVHVQLHSKLSSVFGLRFADQHLEAHGSGVNSVENNPAWADEESLTDHINHHLAVTLRHDSNYAFVSGKDAIWCKLSDCRNTFRLKTQTGQQFAFNIDWHSPNNWLQASVYRLNINHELALGWYLTPKIPQEVYSYMTNLDPTQRDGVNLLDHWKFKPHWMWQTQLSYVNPRMRSGQYKGNIIPGVSAWNGSLGLEYQASHHWLIQLDESLHSSFYASFDMQNKGGRLPGYALTNLHIQKQSHGITYDLSINNLLNHNTIRYANYYIKTNKVGYFPADGISVLFHITMNLAPGL